MSKTKPTEKELQAFGWWRDDHQTIRPHSASGCLTPEDFPIHEASRFNDQAILETGGWSEVLLFSTSRNHEFPPMRTFDAHLTLRVAVFVL